MTSAFQDRNYRRPPLGWLGSLLAGLAGLAPGWVGWLLAPGWVGWVGFCRIFDALTWTVEQDGASPTSVVVGFTETRRPRGMLGNEGGKFAARSRWRHMFSCMRRVLKKAPQLL